MLLEGRAATWWKGIKCSIADWNGAVSALREAYSLKLPLPLIYRKFFECEQQDSETTELFVCHLRALSSQLPLVLPTSAELDMVYGLLKRGIRQRVTRNDFDTFNTLPQRAHDIEMSERKVKQTTRVESKSDKVDRKLHPKFTLCKPASSNDQMTSSSFTFNKTTMSISDQANRPMIAINVQDAGYIQLYFLNIDKYMR
ncbi:Activity-regulated cytoskeleton associated protein 1 [Carabus blaptoides fortunei]